MKFKIPNKITSLSIRLLVTTLLWVSFVVLSMGYTMVLNWQLEASANAKGAISEIRYHIFQAALANKSTDNYQKELNKEIDAVDKTFSLLKAGDSWLPLAVPRTQAIQNGILEIRSSWYNEIRPLLSQGAQTDEELLELLSKVKSFSQKLTSSTLDIDNFRSYYQWQSRYLQVLLIVLAIGSLFAIMAFLYHWVIHPLERVGDGMHELSSGNLKARVPVERDDEIGDIAKGFNYMADRLSDLYSNLEQKVIEKTLTVDEKNRHLAQLYDITSFFAEQNPLEEVCDGFVERIALYSEADACLVELLTSETGKSYIETQKGIDPDILEEMDELLTSGVGDDSVSRGKLSCVELTQNEQWKPILEKANYARAYGFQIRGMDDPIGAFFLFFKKPYDINPQFIKLLETIATNLGGAIETRRLIEMDRQYAVIQERNLLAQGLHDSIAQALSYLNLQVQFLKNAIADGKDSDRDEALQNIENGVQESYDDVRELLLNFRERLHTEGFEEGLRSVLQRFEVQSKVSSTLRFIGNGVDLTDRQKLQVIFIVQEALSNVRKHAQASHVYVNVENMGHFKVTVTDDGVGLDPELMKSREKNHVGLSIMAERAQRIGAKVTVEMATPIGGTKVTLFLPEEQRRGH